MLYWKILHHPDFRARHVAPPPQGLEVYSHVNSTSISIVASFLGHQSNILVHIARHSETAANVDRNRASNTFSNQLHEY